MERCPKCNINLGCSPLEKLRPDHNLQDVRAKVFPFKRRKVIASENMTSISLPVRRKERSLSSLVVSAPRVSTQNGMTGRRSKSFTRKAVASRGCGFPNDQSIKKEEASMEGFPESSSSRETLSKLSHPKRQTTGNQNNNHNSSKDEENDTEDLTGNADVWKPLNCLVEAANRTKSIKFVQGSDVKSETAHVANSELRGSKGKFRKHSQKRFPDDDNGNTSVSIAKSKKSKTKRKKPSGAPDELGTSAQAIISSSNFKRDKNSPIWFKLVAAEDQEGDKALPQISSSYVRIKDGDIAVSYVQKYIVKKLDLSSEAEVEITCRGQPVEPGVSLNDVVDLWLQSASRSERVHATVGSSGQDFVMVLAYRRKHLLIGAP